MGCTACGDKPKNDRHFPGAVIEINNPEKLIAFRKVVIPASLGDDTAVPASIGKYRNVILYYEANSHVYLYSSDGIPTLIAEDIGDLDELWEAIEAEGTARTEADDVLLARIEAEESNRAMADAALEQDIVEEAAARASADSALSSSVDSLSSSLSSEEAARQAADAALSTAIADETSARGTADTTLQSNIDGVASDLTAEATARAQADATLQNNIDSEASARTSADSALDARVTANATAISNETTARQGADANLQSQIDAITASSDVKDIVGTYAQLQAYDTSTLGNNDIIKVLQDETHSNETTYYRWNATTQQFTLIGEEGPYYTKSQTDTLLNAKQDTLTAGSNIQISGSTISATDTTYAAGNGLDLTGTTFSADTTVLATQVDLATKQDTLTAGNNIQISGSTISATDTTYSDFTGTDGTTAGAAGLVPAPATTDAGKFLKADGTWDTAGSAINVVQTTGTSTTDVMSQNAVTSMVFADPSTKQQVQIGSGAAVNGQGGIAIGFNSSTGTARGQIALGATTYISDQRQAQAGVMSIQAGNTFQGYNSTVYRLLEGLYDPQSAHDAATKGYVDTAIAGAGGASEINSTDWSALWQ